MAVSKLLISTLFYRKMRSALTIAAIALAVSLVVAVTSGYKSAEAALSEFVTHYVGANNIEISPRGDAHQVVSQKIIDELAEDPAVSGVVGRLEMEASLSGPKRQDRLGMVSLAIGVDLPADTQVAAMKLDQGQWFSGRKGDVVVIDQVASERLNAKPGDTITLLHPQHPLKLKVVGIVHKPAVLAMHFHSIYVPLETLQGFAQQEGKVSRILVDPRPGADEKAFVQRWSPRLDKAEPSLKIRRSGERQEEMQRNLAGVSFLSYLGGTVAMLAATFIVFATLSMGVAERSRSLAMLRAVGALKSQIGWLVVYEGLTLAAMGVGVGVPLGWLWTWMLAAYHHAMFSAGVHLSYGGMAFGAVGMLLAAVAASFLPAWTATRVSPLEAMTPLGQPHRARTPWLAAAIALPLLAVDPLIIFGGLPRNLAFYGHFGLGLPALFLGFFLLAPACVWIVERTLGRIVAPLAGLEYPLLRQQLSGSLWRAAGTAAALMVGLAILVVMQVQGTTLMSGWRLPDKFPDVFIVAPFGLDQQQEKVLEDAPGIRPGQVMPIAISSPELGLQLFSVGSTNILPDATMFFGVDVDKMDMIELDFRQGNEAEAKKLLKQGRHILVTSEFQQLKKIKIGDKLPLKTPLHGTVEYTVAGVVWSPGLDVIVSLFDMGRQFEERTVSCVFGSIEDARNDFGIDKVHLFAANLQYGVQKEDLAAKLSDAMEKDREKNTPGGLSGKGLSIFQLRKLLGASGFLVGDVRHIKAEIEQAFRYILLLLSTVALAAIAVASLGVTNTIMASVRSRRWQFGILRSVGVTRFQLLRLILAEAALLGLVACALGLGAGFLLSVDANGLTRLLVGYGPSIAVPWKMIWAGVAIILAVALGASLWPAISAARTRPLDLLQWGRAGS